MHLLYITQVYHPKGAASITTRGIVEGLVKKGHSVDLLVALPCISNCTQNCSLGCNKTERISVRRSPLPTLSSFEKHMSIRVIGSSVSYIFLIIYALLSARKKKFDLVLVMYHAIHLAPFSALLISKFTKAPLIIKCHDVVSTESRWKSLEKVFCTFTSKLNSMALKQARKILALSSELACLIKKMYNVPEERFITLPNGVDTRMFECNQDLNVHKKLAVQNRKVMLYMGSLEPIYRKEGIKFLMRAMPKVITEVSDVVLLLIGSMSRGVRKDLESLAYSLKIEKWVKFVESVPHEDMPAYISTADVCIGPLCPSLETLGSTPRKVLEYMACAKPVIVCRGGVSSDLVKNGYNGLIVRYGNLEELASSITELFKNPALAKKMGSNARHHAVAFYDQDTITDRLNVEIEKLRW